MILVIKISCLLIDFNATAGTNFTNGGNLDVANDFNVTSNAGLLDVVNDFTLTLTNNFVNKIFCLMLGMTLMLQ